MRKSRFTDGFSDLYTGNHMKAKPKQRKSSMFCSSSKYSKTTQILVENMAKQSGLNSRQMKFLGSQIAKKSVLSRQSKPKSNSRQQRSHYIHKRPQRKTKRSIEKEIEDSFSMLHIESKRKDDSTKQSIERRETEKWRLQNSHLSARTADKLFLATKQVNKPKRISPRVAAAAAASYPRFRDSTVDDSKNLDKTMANEKLFKLISGEIDERRKHLLEMRQLGQSSEEFELRIQAEIIARVREMEKLHELLH